MMQIFHVVVGDMAGNILKNNILSAENESVLACKDLLNVGSLKEDGITFSQVRSNFWAKVLEKETEVNDLEKLMEISTHLSNNDDSKIWIWMGDWAPDVCLYFFLLHYFKKHIGKLYVINIAGLPFLNDEGRLYFPKNISELSQAAITKARKLRRVITESEWEIDGDEWAKLVLHNDGIRTLTGNKQIKGFPINYYDELFVDIKEQDSESKVKKFIYQQMQEKQLATGDLFLRWRLKNSAEGK